MVLRECPLSPKADIVRHGSKSRDVGRVSRRGLGRLLARRPALPVSSRYSVDCSAVAVAALGALCCPTTPFLWLMLPDEQEARPQPLSRRRQWNIVNIRGPALTVGTVDLVNFRSGKILQPRRNEGTSTPSHSLRNGAAGLAKTRINRFNGIVRYAPVSCRLVRGELA